MKIYTIGFTKKSAESFFTLIKKSGVRRIIDIRRNNSSQLAGFAKENDLKYFLKELCHIEYMHTLDLAPTEEILLPYRHKEHTWQKFKQDYINLLAERKIEKVLDKKLIDKSCLLCGEAESEHCHRTFLVEYLQAHWQEKSAVGLFFTGLGGLLGLLLWGHLLHVFQEAVQLESLLLVPC